MPSCPIYVGSPAVALVNEGWGFFQNQALSAVDLAKNLIVDLTQFQLNPVDFNYTFDPPSGPNGFHAPDPPPDPNIIYDPSGFHDPGATPPTGISAINFAPVPAYTGPSTVAQYAQLPTDARPEKDYGDAPTISDVTVPIFVPFTNPDLPTLLPINLPTLLPINLPIFTATAPEDNLTPPSAQITFVPQPYASTNLTDIQNRLSQMLVNDMGLPPAVEAALFARARSRLDNEAFKAVQEATEEFAARGFTYPPGALSAKLQEIRQNNQNQLSAQSRDIYIQSVQNLQFAVQQGIALEGKLADIFMVQQQLQLQAQKYMVDAAVEIFNAQVSMFNAKQQAYAIAAQVFKDRILAEAQKVEIYKGEIEAQRLIEEINKDQVAVYEAKLRALNLLLEQYKAQLAGVQLQTEIDKNRVEIFRARVSAYSEEVRAWAVEWDAYKAQVEGDATRARIFETQVNAYATQVRAVAEGNNNLVAQGTLTLESQKTAMLGWRGKLDRLLADIDAEAKRIQAGVSIFDGKARIYAASGQIAASESDANTRAFQAVVEAGRAARDIGLKNAEAHIQQIVQIGTIMAEQLKAAAATAAQLAAGAMSAVHFAAQASDSSSIHQGSECSTSYTFSGAA